jgi:hypothetical protein
MQTDPIMEWQRLTEHYRGLHDEELCELALDIGNLTDTAEQALRQELRSRGLGEPETAMRAMQERHAAESIAASDSNGADGTAGPEGRKSVDYTWKTLLCECEERIEALQLYLVLKRAGIESWAENPGKGLVYSRILVPADQLEEARALAEQPIPPDIVNEAKDMLEPAEEYELPVCPKCGAADPILEAAEPTNEWLCEACGAEWADAMEDEEEAG